MLALSALVIFGALGALALRTSQTKQARDEGLAQIQRIIEQAQNGQITWEQASAQIRSILGSDFGLGNIFENSPPVTVIEEGSGVEPASYVVFGVDTSGDGIADEIYAKSGDNGAIAFSGTNAAAVINAAISALPNGGKVLIKKGTYSITASINLASNIALVGEGPGTILRIPDNFNADLYGVIAGSGVNHVLVANLRIDGNKANQTAGTQVGIYFTSVTYSEVRRCWVENTRSAAIAFYSDVNHSTIAKNTCRGNDGYCIYLYSSHNNTVIGNTCQGNSNYGILLGNSNNNTVAGNTCQGNGAHGIYLTYANGNAVVGNTCQGNGACGIFVYGYNSHNAVTGNTCLGNANAGIEVNSNSSSNTVVGNICQGNGGDGILLAHGSNNNIVAGNSLLGNSQMTDNANDGIRVMYDCNYNLISNNIVRHQGLTNQQRYGISIDSADCDGNLVVNNDLYLSGRAASLNDAGTGTVLHTSEHVVPVIAEVARTGLVDSEAGVKWTSAEILIPPGAFWSAAIEATWTASATDSVNAIELYDATAGAVAASVSGNAGTNAKSSYACLTAGHRYVVRVNVTTASATAGATLDVTKAVLYIRPNSNRL